MQRLVSYRVQGGVQRKERYLPSPTHNFNISHVNTQVKNILGSSCIYISPQLSLLNKYDPDHRIIDGQGYFITMNAKIKYNIYIL